MTERNCHEKGTLLLSFIIGVAVHGTFSTLFNSFVSFSIFPILALCLAVYCFHQRYLHHPIPEGLPKIVTGLFFLGLFAYNALLRVEHPEMGSNFFSSIIIVALVFWLYRSIKVRKEQCQIESEDETQQNHS